MGSFRFTVLGSNSALPSSSRHPSSHVVTVHERVYLIDAGEGVQSQLRRSRCNAHKIDHIFISHLHGDHFYGIYGLISTLGLLGREKELNIYAPAPVEEIIASHIKYFENNLPYNVVCHTVDTKKSEVVYENRVLTVKTIPLKHRILCCGYLFEEKCPPLNVRKEAITEYGLGIAQIADAKRGEDIVSDNGDVIYNKDITYIPYKPRKFAYCSDTAYSEKVVEAVKGVDLLYHEATFLERDKALAKKTGHSTAAAAARVAKKAEVKKMIIGHFSHRYDSNDSLFENEAREIFSETYIAEELKTFTITAESGFNLLDKSNLSDK